MSYHYKSIGVKNFKGFKEKVEFEIKPLTVLTGPNNSGKSTVAEIIALLSESLEYSGNPLGYAFVKDWEILQLKSHSTLEIKDWKEMVSKGAKDDTVHFYFKFYSSEYKKDVEIDMGYQFQKSRGVLVEYKISIEDWPLIHLKKKEMHEHYPDKNLFAINREKDPLGYTKENLKISPRKYQSKMIWVSPKSKPSDKDVKKTLSFIRKEIRDKISLDKKNEEDIKNPLNDSVHWAVNKPDSLSILPNNKKRLFINSNLWFERMKNFKELRDSESLGNQEEQFLSEYKDFENQLLYKLFSYLFLNPHQLIPFEDWSVEFKNDLDWYRGNVKTGHQLKIKNIENHEAVRSSEFNDLWRNEPNKKNLQEILKIINSIDSPIKAEFEKEIKDSISKDKYFSLEYVNQLSKILFWSVQKLRQTNENSFVESIQGVPKAFRSMDDVKPYYFFDDNDWSNQHLYTLAQEYLKINPRQWLWAKGDIYGIEMDFINKWINNFEIGDELIFEPVKSLDKIVGFSLYIVRKKEKYPVYMEGIGVKKLINLIIFLRIYGDHISLEEPEANLHPSHQSKLSELLVDSLEMTSGHTRGYIRKKDDNRLRNDPLTLIVETHSEYLIRKIQYLIASKDSKLTTADVSVNYLHSPNKVPKGEKQVYGLKIREDGLMDNDFGPGFFDESLKLSLGLLGMNKN